MVISTEDSAKQQAEDLPLFNTATKEILYYLLLINKFCNHAYVWVVNYITRKEDKDALIQKRAKSKIPCTATTQQNER